MVTRENYNQREVEACKSVLIELVHLLGQHKDALVLVGGWVPPLLYSNSAHEHVGSIDIVTLWRFYLTRIVRKVPVPAVQKKPSINSRPAPQIFS